MDNKAKLFRRLIAMVCMLAVLGTTAFFALFRIQIVEGETYRGASERRLTSTTPVSASRGEIFDRTGRPLTTNRSVFSLWINYVYWDQANANETILKLAGLVLESGAEPVDTLPISDTGPFEFTAEPDTRARTRLAERLTQVQEELSKRKDDEGEPVKLPKAETVPAAELTAEAAVSLLRRYFNVDTALTAEEARIIVGIRSEMQWETEFSRYNPYTFAKDVGLDLIAQVKERHLEFEGVDVAVGGVRQYNTTSAPHLLGYVGQIFQEDWPEYREKGYKMNAIVGKEGLEYTLEEYLRGVDGTRTVETDLHGNVTAELDSNPPQPGHHCITTIDLSLQQSVEEALARTLQSVDGAEGGAAVVLDVNSAEVLAMASYPDYNLERYHQEFSQYRDDPRKPYTNRAIQETYAPGSTFKPLMAVAALESGTLERSFTQVCTRYYTYFDTQTFRCLGYHGRVGFVKAIEYSCNYFFYEVGRLLGGAKIEEWAAKFGLGQRTGIELQNEAAGNIAGPTGRKVLQEKNSWLHDWLSADSVQAAIGQSDHAYTPLQLANYMAAVVNGGTVYRPTLLKSVKTYDYTDTVYEHTPEVVSQIDISPETLEIVREGMKRVINEGTAARAFYDCVVQVGGKSGTAQVGRNELANGLFIAFAPFDDPEIAICVVGEKIDSGTKMAPAVADIVNAYFANRSETETELMAAENTMLH